MRKLVLNHDDVTLFGHDVSAQDYSFFTKHKDAFMRMCREQGLMFWKRFMVSFKAYTMSYGIIENPLKKTNGEQYYNILNEAFNYLECQIFNNTTKSPKLFVEDSGVLAQYRHLLGGIEAKPYKTSKDPFYMKETREVFRRVFGDPKGGSFLTLRISRLRHDVEELRKEREENGIYGVDIQRPLHLMPKDVTDTTQDLNTSETTMTNRADITAAKKEEKRPRKKGSEEKIVTDTHTGITGLEMKRGADGTKFKVQFAQGGVSHVDVTRKGEEVKIKVTRTNTANGVPHNDEESARELHKLLETDADTVRKKSLENETRKERECSQIKEGEAKVVEEAVRRSKEANRGKPLDKESEYLRIQAKETFAEIDKDNEKMLTEGKKLFGIDDPLIKLLREVVQDSPDEEEKDENPQSIASTASTVSSTASASSSTSSKKKRHKCANCNTREEVRKTYKACLRCRDRQLKPKYYCSRTCQVRDWEARHKAEHKQLDSKQRVDAAVGYQDPEGDETPDEGIAKILQHLKIHRDHDKKS